MAWKCTVIVLWSHGDVFFFQMTLRRRQRNDYWQGGVAVIASVITVICYGYLCEWHKLVVVTFKEVISTLPQVTR